MGVSSDDDKIADHSVIVCDVWIVSRKEKGARSKENRVWRDWVEGEGNPGAISVSSQGSQEGVKRKREKKKLLKIKAKIKVRNSLN